MKGQQEVISVILISGILIGVVGSVYLWGVPLIQKNKDIALLESSENFMRNLDSKIRFVSNNGGRDLIKIPGGGLLEFDSTTGELVLAVETEGTIYATDAEIPLGRNGCTASKGRFGTDDPASLCVKSSKIVEKKYRTTYILKYILLEVNDTSISRRDFEIKLIGRTNSGGEDRAVVFDNKGTTSTDAGGRTLVSNIIGIDIA